MINTPFNAAGKKTILANAGIGRSLAAWLAFFCFLSIAVVPWLLMFQVIEFGRIGPAVLAWLVIGFLAAGATTDGTRRA